MSLPPRLICAALLLAVLTGCGYRNTAESPFLLSREDRTLFLTEVENPTLRPTLDSRLRSLVRDEFTRRLGYTWTGKEVASALFSLEIINFTSSTAVAGARDQTLKSSANISLRATVRDKEDYSVLWDSGIVAASQTFLSGEQQAAEDRVILLAVERLADKLENDF
jgi:hypothetical protein